MSEQLTFDALPDPTADRVGRFHADGPETEREAAELVMPRSGSQRARILTQLYAVGEHGATDYELNELLNPGRRSVCAGTRRAELIRDGWPIVDSGRRRPTDTATPAIVWILERSNDDRVA